jgi:hypothetical protein
MKVILSRKGFDSGKNSGQCASPIYPDGSMFSFPIPSARGSVAYSEISANGKNIGKAVDSLTSGKTKRENMAHLDPDIDVNAIPRKPGWLPAFGAGQGPRTHLERQGVSIGDLFLFFGWFRDVGLNEDGSPYFLHDARNLHAIFGWLQVGRILNVGINGENTIASNPWIAEHPHVSGEWYENNTIYVASDQLNIPGVTDNKNIKGGGVFGSIAESRVLSHPGQSKRSVWCLPKSFSPQPNLSTLSYHGNYSRWQDSSIPDKTKLQTVIRGQEFVLNVKDLDSLNAWLRDIYMV